jgi:outer membrane phospholipase A
MNSLPAKFVGVFVFALALAAVVRAESLIVTAIPPAGPVPPASEVLVGLMAVNPGSGAASFQPPATLRGSLRQGARTWPVELRVSGARGPDVAPGGFATLGYTLTLPRGLLGQFVLEIPEGLAQPVCAIITVEVPAVAGRGRPRIDPDYSVVSLSSQPVNSLLARSFIDHFSVHDPMYFVYGSKAPAAKFQFSLKYRLLSFEEGPTGADASSVQFGYTQRSLWDVNAHPSAFYDTSYIPSVFYQFLSPAANPDPGKADLTWLGFSTGYQHESNGQGGDLERSLNTLFVRSGLLIGRTDKWHSVVLVRAFTYIEGVANNPEIKDYRGYGDWGVTLADGAGPSLTYTGWAGKKFNHATTQLDLNIPVHVKIVDFETFLVVQYFDGYGESLKEYQAHSNVLRAGISLVR